MSILSAIYWWQPVPQRYDIDVGMTDYVDSSAFQEECAPQMQTTAKTACRSEPTLLSKHIPSSTLLSAEAAGSFSEIGIKVYRKPLEDGADNVCSFFSDSDKIICLPITCGAAGNCCSSHTIEGQVAASL